MSHDLPDAAGQLGTAARAAISTVLGAARRFGHLHPAVATALLTRQFLHRLNREELAATLAALAMHTTRHRAGGR